MMLIRAVLEFPGQRLIREDLKENRRKGIRDNKYKTTLSNSFTVKESKEIKL